MKLLLLISSLGSGGAERQLVTLATLFHRQGVHVEFLVYFDDDFYKHILDNQGIKVNRLYPKNNFDRIIKVRRFIRQSNFDGVISFLETNNFLASFSAVGRKKWTLITNELSSKESTFNSQKGKIYAYFQRYSDVLVCNSHNAKNMWEQYYPQYKEKLTVIYNPVILPKITSEYIPKQDGKLHIVIAASYQYLKNPIGLINALLLMSKEDLKALEINWYGNHSFENDITNAFGEASELVEKHKLQKVLKFNHATIDIANKVHEADVVALFSELEGLPNAICEGMMLGKPIIMSKVSDYNILVDETNGFLCDWDNPTTIQDALIKAMKLSKQELKKMGQASNQKALDLFNSNLITNQWLSLIQ